MLAGDVTAKTKYPTILDLKNKEAEFDKTMSQYVTFYKQYINSFDSNVNSTWKDYNDTMALSMALDTPQQPGQSNAKSQFLGKFTNLQACKNSIKEGNKFSSIIFIGENSKTDSEEWKKDCYGYLDNPTVNPNEIGKNKGIYTSVLEQTNQSADKEKLANKIQDLNNKLKMLINEINTMVTKIFPQGVDLEEEAGRKFLEIQEKAKLLDNERENITKEIEIITDVKAQRGQRKNLYDINSYLFFGFTACGVGLLAYTIKELIKENRNI